MLEKNQIEKAEITAMSSDGNGIARIDGTAVFVPYTAIGDAAKIRVVKALKNYCYGVVEELIKPSPDRVESSCPVYGKCGGCSFRHVSYEAETRYKEEFVRSNLGRIGGLDPVLSPIIPSPQFGGYRNKAQYPIREIDGKIEAGFFAKRSRRLVPCANCDLQPRFFGDILSYTKNFLQKNHISAYDDETGKGKVRALYIRYGEATGEVMVCPVVSSPGLKKASEYADGLLKVCPRVVSVILNVNPDKTNVILGKTNLTVYGKDSISDYLCSLRFDLSPLSFYQVNRRAAEKLYRLAAESADLRGDETLLDLYCGTGAIGLTMASRVGELIGVEIVPDAVRDARANAERLGIKNARFILADAREAAAGFAESGIKPDVVVVDPPRKGCAPEVLEAISKTAPEKLVMISCDSASLARDCKRLSESGYRLVRAVPVDLFPRTVHVETVALMLRVRDK